MGNRLVEAHHQTILFVILKNRMESGVHFGEAFGPTEKKKMTGNMRQNVFGHDQDRDFIRVFKYCYFSVNKYLQHVHLINV